MRIVAICGLVLVAAMGSASACDDTYTASAHEPGAIVLKLGRDGDVTIAAEGEDIKHLDLRCAGTPATCVLIDPDDPDGDTLGFEEPEDGTVLIDGEPFRPYCPAPGKPSR